VGLKEGIYKSGKIIHIWSAKVPKKFDLDYKRQVDGASLYGSSREFFSFHGSTLLDSSFSSSLSQGPSHLCSGFFWQVVGASLKFSPRKFLPIFTLVLLGKSWPPPWFVDSWWISPHLAHERRKLLSMEWGPKAAGCRYGTPWTQAYGWECGWECGVHLLGLGRKCNTPGWNPSPLLSQHDSTK